MGDRTHRTFAPAPPTQWDHDQERWRLAHREYAQALDEIDRLRAEVRRLRAETYRDALEEIDRLRAEVYRLGIDRDHWYAAANYTPEEIHEQFMRASKGLDENGAWLWPDGLRTTKE